MRRARLAGPESPRARGGCDRIGHGAGVASPPVAVLPVSPIVIARGARAAEAFLLGELGRLHDQAHADLSLLAQPVRVVVPSRSLRDHLVAQLLRRRGAVAGLQVQTLRALAFELLERAGEHARGGQTLVPVLVRRFAAAEPALAGALAAFDDGFGVALASVNDLLDAGLDAASATSALECLGESGGAAGAAARERAEALVRVAERTLAELAARGLEPRAGFFRRAALQLGRNPALLPARAMFVYGWADVTGVQLDLIEALVRTLGARVVLDHPPDPADASAEGPGPAWTERLRLRLGGGRGVPGVPAAVSLEACQAPGTHAEARAVAERIRARLDRGEQPESIGIVLRDPAPYRHALCAQLTRLGVPFSGSAGAVGPTGRRIHALLELLERHDGCPADRWLDAQQRSEREALADLRLALHGIGVGRLRDVAALDLERLLGPQSRYALPVRRGISAGASVSEVAAGGEEAADEGRERKSRGAPQLLRRFVSRGALAQAAAEATAVLDRIAALRAAPSFGAQLDELRRLLARELGWRHEAPAARALSGALATLEAELGQGLELSTDELLVVLRRAFSELGREPLGGQGGGVALLSAVEARGRSFAELFLMGMNRDVFPRMLREDPLLPDALRRALEVVLPDVPVKGRGEDEERYLFAALCAAAPSVTLSWLATSDDGKERPPSPLLEPLRASGLTPRLAPPLLAERSAPRPAFEHAIRAGIARERGQAEHALAVALGCAEAAHARAGAIAALDVGGWAGALGPFFGFVGAVGADDPRSGELAITRLEGMARCAWQTFLERVLRIEPPPDALAELPDATPLLIGSVVHAVLEKLVGDAGGAVDIPLAEALALAPLRIEWPAADELAQRTRAAAEQVAREEGIVLPGVAALLARRARPLLERIRALEWVDGGPLVLGAELRGSVQIGERSVSFRADRADLGEVPALVDYKTGAPITSVKGEDTRRAHLLAQIAQGRRLQAPAYARAGEPVREGRYLFAKDGVDEANAKVRVARDDPEAMRLFEAAARELLAAFELGAFPPRLLGEKRSGKGPACASCDVAEACIQGETGSGRHLAAWLDRNEPHPERLPPAARAALALLLRVEKK